MGCCGRDLLPKDLPIFAQDDADAALIRSQGFRDVRVLETNSSFGRVFLTKVPGLHGSAEALAAAGKALGNVCGVVFRHPEEKTTYFAGDSVWNNEVETNLTTHTRAIVVLNAGDARIPGLGSITMGKEDVRRVHHTSPDATLIAVHMEALNHCVLSRTELRAYAEQHDISDKLWIPNENENHTF